MAKTTRIPTALAEISAERDRIAGELRRIADRLDTLAPADLREVLVAIVAAVEQLRRAAETWMPKRR